MTRNVSSLCAFFLAIFGCSRDPLVDILHDIGVPSAFVCVKVRSGKETMEIVIENGKLYRTLHAKEGMELSRYREVLLESLRNSKPVDISESIMSSFLQFVVTPAASIDLDKSRGKDEFIKQYFKNGVLAKELGYQETKYLIKVLFEWRVYVRRDDESGTLTVVNR